MTSTKIDYLNPDIPAGVSEVEMPIQVANAENLEGYGQLVSKQEYENFPVEIVRWPATGWRPVDEDTGDEAGTTQGVFESYWKGDVLYGRNEAVDGHYIIGYGTDPNDAVETHQNHPEAIFLWHANYHPDGGQLFFPLEPKTFVVPLALPGDDVKPEDFVCFVFDGSAGLYIHPNVWHEGVFTCSGEQRFFDKQGAVHARVSVNLPKEFDCLLKADITGLT